MIDIRMDIDENYSVGDYENLKLNSDDENFSFIDDIDRKNIFISDEKGIFRVLEYKMDLSSKNPQQAMENFYLNKAKVYKKQLLVTLGEKFIESYEDNYRVKTDPTNPLISTVCINPRDMMYMDGSVDIRTNIKGMGDFIGKALSGTVTGEGMIKPRYVGNGYIMLLPTYKYIILHDLRKGDFDLENGLVISDGSFLACSGNVKLSAIPVSSISSAALGREGVFNLHLKGKGVIAYTSPVPKSDITIIELKDRNDVLKVNGSYALAWSDTLDFTVEPSSLNLLGTAISSEGYVNVYRGIGKVWLANVNI